MKKPLEERLYEPVQQYLKQIFAKRSANCHLEITARGNFSDTLKHLVRQDIIFSFLKKASPDLTGFVLRGKLDLNLASSSDVQSFITVEVKRDKLTLQDIYQAKMYGDLFHAKYALLLSPETIGEEIRRLHKRLSILNRFRGWKVYIGQVFVRQRGRSIIEIADCVWFPETPF